MNRTIARVYLLIVYVPLSFVVSLLFIRSDGFGSHAPPAILFSWGVLPGEYGLVSKVIGFWLISILYLVSLAGVTSACTHSSRIGVSMLPFVFHGVGVLFALAKVTQHAEHAANVTRRALIASYVTASLITTAYLLWDWFIARKSTVTNSSSQASAGNTGTSKV